MYRLYRHRHKILGLIFRGHFSGSEYNNFIGLQWLDVQDDPPYDDIFGQFIARHHHMYYGGTQYGMAQDKCLGCNFILLNGLYEFMQETGQQWP